jgi:hypothetical protein
MGALPTSLTIVFPNYKINPRLSGNGRGSAYMKREAQRLAKADGQRLCLAALDEAGTWASDFLTNGGEYTLDEALPLTVICRRFYSGHSQLMDKENCLMGFKYYIDGIAKALASVNDRDFDLKLEQAREKTGHRFEISLIPAWAVKEQAA